MLFGVRVEGQLGGRTELIEAYEMFHHAYIEPRQQKIDDVFSYLLEPIAQVRLETINKPPIGLDYQALFTAGIIDRNEARKELGFDEIEEEETPVALSKQNPFGWDDERDLIVFNKYGEKAEDFEEAKFEFADAIESAILNVLKENKGLQVGDIVNITKLDAKVVADAIAKLAKAELVKSYEDGLETTPKGLEEIKNLQTELVVRYQYGLAPGITGGLLIDTSRKFCTDVVNSGRVYSREDINMMSAELEYDVWKRRGQWYTNPSTGITTPQCRHIWVQKLLRRIKR